MKHLISIIFLALLPFVAEAYNAKIDGIYYNLGSGATVTYKSSKQGPNGMEYYSDYSGDLVIPSKITYNDVTYKVKGISKFAFYNCKDLTNITIPNSVTSIGERAFYSCENLSSLTIPNSVTSLGDGAFQYCFGLSSVSIGTGISSIPVNCFEGCGISSIELLNIGYIGYSAFGGCSNLTSITFGEKLYYIDQYAFSRCTNIKDVYCYAEKVPETEGGGFAKSIVHVPIYSVNLYKTTTPWSNATIVPLENPEHHLIYIVDQTIYNNSVYKEGDMIIQEPEPIKEGYTFSGWSEIPEIMPKQDVIVTGIFNANRYSLSYKVDNAVFRTYDIEYGATINAENAPSKEGYTFSGWSEIPETMPAHDVEVTGSFTINSYKLTYMVDGVEFKVADVEYGATIVPEEAPEKPSYTFTSWNNLPETMPAHDVTVTATYEKTFLGKCATPTIAFKDGKFKFESEEEGVEFVWNISVVGNSGKGSEVGTPRKYILSVCATKEFYEDSEPATMEMGMSSPIGDVNGDGVVNAADIASLVDIILHM